MSLANVRTQEQIGRRHRTNNRFSQFCESAQKEQLITESGETLKE